MIRSLFDRKRGEEVRRAIRSGNTDGIFKNAKPQHEPLRTPQSGLEVFIRKETGVTMEDAIRMAGAGRRVIASNNRMDAALVGSDEWKSVEDGLPCWTGTMTAYEEAGKPFGKTVEYTDDNTGIRYVFPVPDEFVGVKDAILVSEHPGFTLETDGNDRTVRAARVELIKRFPAATHKWYLADSKYGISFGDEIDSSDPDARKLWRIAKRVGLVARTHNYEDGDWRVVLSSGPFVALGVVAVAADAKEDVMP